jgi:hypothetical protein
MSEQQTKRKLNESLRYGDLKNFVNEVFGIDRYKSKMGDDSDIVVVSFRVKEKFPALDLVEFIERGYPFILDADMSSGEEHDGQYQVFVEIERTPNLPGQLRDLLGGISNLTDQFGWKFKYQKDSRVLEFDEKKITETVPTTPEAYSLKIVEYKNSDIKEFFDQGATDVALESDNTITFSKPYSGDITAKFISIGNYDDVKHTVPGAISLDESSRSQTVFLNKFLGNYDINKIGNKFLIRNGDRAIVIEKNNW